MFHIRNDHFLMNAMASYPVSFDKKTIAYNTLENHKEYLSRKPRKSIQNVTLNIYSFLQRLQYFPKASDSLGILKR